LKKSFVHSPVLLIPLLILTTNTGPGYATDSRPRTFAETAIEAKSNSQLKFLRTMREGPLPPADSRREMLSAASSDMVTLTVKFDHVLLPAETAELESRGCVFYRAGGEIARTRSIYPVKIPWSMIESLGVRADVLRLEGTWKPAVFPTLDVSRVETQADSAWQYDDPLGYPISGRGMRVADFDTGIDVFHPSFFYADGDTFDWLDYNGSGEFEQGADAVDLNGNGNFDFGEVLRFHDGRILDYSGTWGGSNPANSDYVYQTFWDWLYADQNYNQRRDFGPGDGFGDSDPGFGEPCFITLDEDHDGVLDVGERLVQLGTSKIYATMNADSIERVRGVDLTLSDDDTNGHGTAVMGIVAGGTPGYHRFCGLAPDAELLAGYFFSGVPISYLIPWARSREADVMLYEFGGFVWEFLDGSTLDEELISIENETIIQVTPSGNLGRGDKHAIVTVPGGGSRTLNVNANPYGDPLSQVYWTALWRTSIGDLALHLESPAGSQIELTGGVQYMDGYYIWSDADVSSRGTCKTDIYIDRNTNPDVGGTWLLTIGNSTGAAIEVISNVADNLSSWAGGAQFANYATDDRNVTWPATADSAFCNGSYSTRGFEGYGGVGGGSIPAGGISAFSGRGPRIDGDRLLDIASPGNYDVWSTISHTDNNGFPLGGYRQFSGTSAAGPHVAAAAALVQQAFPSATMAEVEYLLASHALEDGFTGTVYNHTWGYGKLRILGAIGAPTGVEEMAGGGRPPKLLLDQNWPNPFNPVTWIPFYLPSDGRAGIRIYDVRGGLVKVLREKTYRAGPHSVTWDGTDEAGRNVSSGVYFCVLEQGGDRQTRKMVLIR